MKQQTRFVLLLALAALSLRAAADQPVAKNQTANQAISFSLKDTAGRAVTLAEGIYLLKVPRPFTPPGDENNTSGPDATELTPAQIKAKLEADPVLWNAKIEALRNVGLATGVVGIAAGAALFFASSPRKAPTTASASLVVSPGFVGIGGTL